MTLILTTMDGTFTVNVAIGVSEDSPAKTLEYTQLAAKIALEALQDRVKAAGAVLK